MVNIQLVVFDMAGTTVRDRNEVQRCFDQAAKSTELRAEPEQIKAMMGWSKKRVFQTLWQQQIGSDHPDYASQVEASYAQFKAALEAFYQTQAVEPTDGCLELFDWLRSQNILIALNTGFYREVTNIILQRLGWDRGLNHNYVGSESSAIQVSVTPSEIYGSEGRPAPFMIQKAMYRLGVLDPKSVIVVGDTPSDLEAGKNASCLLSLGVTNGTHSHAELAQYENDGLLASLLDLKEIITAIRHEFEEH